MPDNNPPNEEQEDVVSSEEESTEEPGEPVIMRDGGFEGSDTTDRQNSKTP